MALTTWIPEPDKVLPKLPPGATLSDLRFTTFLVTLDREALSTWERGLYDYYKETK